MLGSAWQSICEQPVNWRGGRVERGGEVALGFRYHQRLDGKTQQRYRQYQHNRLHRYPKDDCLPLPLSPPLSSINNVPFRSSISLPDTSCAFTLDGTLGLLSRPLHELQQRPYPLSSLFSSRPTDGAFPPLKQVQNAVEILDQGTRDLPRLAKVVQSRRVRTALFPLPTFAAAIRQATLLPLTTAFCRYSTSSRNRRSLARNELCRTR